MELLTRHRFPHADPDRFHGFEKLIGSCPAGARGFPRSVFASRRAQSEPSEIPLLLRESTWQGAPEAGRDLAMACLAWDYTLRPSAVSALSSTWLQARPPPPPLQALSSPPPLQAARAAAATESPSATSWHVGLFGATPTVRSYRHGFCCQCSGNCGITGHRKLGDCGNASVAVDLRSNRLAPYCRECICEVSS